MLLVSALVLGFSLQADPPVADDGDIVAVQNTATTITVTGSDDDSDPLTFILVTPPTFGTLSSFGSTGSFSANVVYTPNTNYVGSDSFMFKVNDGSQDSDDAVVGIFVGPPTAFDNRLLAKYLLIH